MCHFRFISLGVNPLPESFQAIRWKIYAEEKTKRIKTNNREIALCHKPYHFVSHACSSSTPWTPWWNPVSRLNPMAYFRQVLLRMVTGLNVPKLRGLLRSLLRRSCLHVS